MAASNKPSPALFGFVGSLTINLFLLFAWYLYFRDYGEAQAQADAQTQKANQLSTAVDSQLAQSQDIRNLIGYADAQELGPAGAPGSAFELLRADLKEFGKAQAADTVRATLSQMRTEINNLQDQVDTLNKGLTTNREQLLNAETVAQNKVDQIQNSQQESEEQLQQQISRYEETVSEKDAKISEREKDVRALETEKQQLADEYHRARQSWEDRETKLIHQVDFLNQQLDELTKVSFERQDGQIVNVDNNTRTVWINLGHLDHLRPQVTFSVYTQDHRGIGRDVEDIKAKIEVTRILGPHISEARILEEDLGRPIGEFDPIYSPLWSAGRTEYFALIGRPDLDEDGDGDWDLFKEVVHNAGGEVDLIVNDEGLREPADASLSARTKFLIVGDLDDPADYSGQVEKQDLAKRAQEELAALKDEARLYGIRVVRLNDFLDYIGYRPQQRLWHPGEERPFNLKNGATSASVNAPLEDRISSGTVSGLYERNGRPPASDDASSGTTSGLFRK